MTSHRATIRRAVAWMIALTVVIVGHLLPMLFARDVPAKKVDEVAAYFDSGAIPVIKLVVPEDQQKDLREKPREYVRGSLHENGKVLFETVAVKLKGAAGSFQELDQQPGLTLNVDKFKKGQRFHGMKKFHLNNCVQDETRLSEWLGAEIFRAAGYPVPRVGHARVSINDRDLGVYVLREGFDQPFLRRSFLDASGNLYDGGFCQDIDSELELDAGTELDRRVELIGLAVACSEEDPVVRWRGISDRIDIDQFLTFMALERLCGHWDGYTLNRNNYRIYFPPGGRGMFLPHGMDQLFGDPGAGLYDHAAPLLAAAVMQHDSWRGQYHERLKKLAPLLKPVAQWHARIDEMQRRLEKVLQVASPSKAKEHRERVRELKERFAERVKHVDELVKNGPGKPMKIDPKRTMTLEEWGPAPDGEDAKLEEVELDGKPCYKITHQKFGDHSSSWQRRVLLPRGEYRVEARIKTENVVPIPDNQGRGAGLRYGAGTRTEGIAGNKSWQQVGLDIRILEDQREVELSLELRARSGASWFDRSSLRLQRIK